MMKRSHIAVLGPSALAASLFAVTVFAAEGNNFRAKLEGFNEVPAVFTAARAALDLRVSDDEKSITFTLDYANLSGPPAAAHVHFGRARTNGGVSFFFCGGDGKPACPNAASGTLTGTILASDVVGPAAQGIDTGNLAAIIEAVRHGAAYANMHTAKFPSGEIRGQIHAEDHHDES